MEVRRKYYALVELFKREWPYENLSTKIERNILKLTGLWNAGEYEYSIHIFPKHQYFRVVEKFKEAWPEDPYEFADLFKHADDRIEWSVRKSKEDLILIARYNTVEKIYFVEHIKKIRDLIWDYIL